jgi:peptide deformylase
MILPIVAYGAAVLKRKADEIDPSYPNLKELIENMWEVKTLQSFKKVFINPIILEEQGALWNFNEGCLSIPDVREDVSRKEQITLQYQDENFETHRITLEGLAARVVQHEYDHIEGVLFTDRISPLKRRLIKNRLASISKGAISVEYKMKFPIKSKR